MKLVNGNIYTEQFVFVKASLNFGEVITELSLPDSGCCSDNADILDISGKYVIPGLVDIHTHGNSGEDFSDGSYEGILKMARFHALHGTTSFAATTATLPVPELEKAFAAALRFHQDRETDPGLRGLAHLDAIHMEGPFFSHEKRGAQNAAYLSDPDFDLFYRFYEETGGLLSLVDIAPELPGAMEFIRKASAYAAVSVAHTACDYDTARTAFSAGASHVTHLFNAMKQISSRDPGPIPAAAENSSVTAELICDGYHVSPACVRLAFSLFGDDRIALITDSLRCTGMPEGAYTLGRQRILLKDNLCRLEDGTIAGSAATLHTCLKNAVQFGIPKESAIKAATWNPARQIGCLDRTGSLSVGKQADFLICDKDLNIEKVFIGGRPV